MIPKRPTIEQPAAWPYAVCRLAYAATIRVDGEKDRAAVYNAACEYLDSTTDRISSYEHTIDPPDAHVPTANERELAKLRIWLKLFG